MLRNAFLIVCVCFFFLFFFVFWFKIFRSRELGLVGGVEKLKRKMGSFCFCTYIGIRYVIAVERNGESAYFHFGNSSLSIYDVYHF